MRCHFTPCWNQISRQKAAHPRDCAKILCFCAGLCHLMLMLIARVNILVLMFVLMLMLHWLPVSERIKFKIILLTHKALHQQSPIYIQDLIRRYSTSRTLRSSYAFRLCHVNYNLKSYGSRAFAVSASELWNKLPIDIRSCDNLYLFKRKLKTHLFSNYFKQI